MCIPVVHTASEARAGSGGRILIWGVAVVVHADVLAAVVRRWDIQALGASWIRTGKEREYPKEEATMKQSSFPAAGGAQLHVRHRTRVQVSGTAVVVAHA